MNAGLRYWLAGTVGGLVLEALLGTVRYDVEGADHYRQYVDAGQPVIFVLWHGRLLPLAHFHRNQGLIALVSRSQDGEYITRLLERWGFRCVRGSSSRGGSSALRQLVRTARDGHSLTITPDGPRGPMQQMKRGALVAAQITGLPVIPAVSGADRAWRLGSWDRFLIPKPFARVRVAYGEPHFVPRDGGEEALIASSRSVEASLNQLIAAVDVDGHRG